MKTKDWENVVIEQIKNSFKRRLTNEQFFLYEEIIEFIGYACSFKRPYKFTFGTMNPEDWQAVVDTITIGELTELLSISYKYPNKTDEQRCFLVLGAVARIFNSRNHKHATRNIKKTKQNSPIQSVDCTTPVVDKGTIKNDNKATSKKQKKSTDDANVIKVCFGEIDGCAIWSGASFFVQNDEKIRVFKKTYKGKGITQYSIAIDCIKVIVDKIAASCSKVVLYDQSNLGFKSCNGKYGKTLLKIKNSFRSFKYVQSSKNTRKLKEIIFEELSAYPIDAFVMKEFLSDEVIETNLVQIDAIDEKADTTLKQNKTDSSELLHITEKLSQAQKEALLSYAQGLAVANELIDDKIHNAG